MFLNRRSFLGSYGLTMATALSGCAISGSVLQPSLTQRLAAIEQGIGGRMGMALLRFDGSVLAAYAADQRFAMCSTFKAALGGLVLEQAEVAGLDLKEEITFGPDDLVPYHPLVERHMSKGRLSIAELAEGAIQLSDNVAANLLLRRLGGPAEMTAFFRRHGDWISRLDRLEPELNENRIDDSRDTTTPRAMSRLMAHLLFGGALPLERQMTLRDWMEGAQTGADRIRAGAPAGWTVGNKTGTGFPDALAVNDIGFCISPGGDAVMLSVYLDRPKVSNDEASAAIADITRLVMAELA